MIYLFHENKDFFFALCRSLISSIIFLGNIPGGIFLDSFPSVPFMVYSFLNLLLTEIHSCSSKFSSSTSLIWSKFKHAIPSLPQTKIRNAVLHAVSKISSSSCSDLYIENFFHLLNKRRNFSFDFYKHQILNFYLL